MSGEKVLVIGGTGFIGQHFITEALKKGYFVTSISKYQSSGISHDNVTYLNCDISDRDSLSSCLKEKNFEYVINFGSYIDHSGFSSGGLEVFNSITKGGINLANHFKDKELRLFLNVGSSDEYGSNSSPQNEDMPTDAFSPYSLAKVFVDDYCKGLYSYSNFPYCSARLFLVFGPNQKLNRFLPSVINSCLQDKDFDCSSGEQIRDFCFVKDVIIGLFAIMDNQVSIGETFNLASGIPISIRDMTLKVINIIGKGRPIFNKIPLRERENISLYANITKAKKMLNWRPSYTLDEGLTETIQSYRGKLG